MCNILTRLNKIVLPHDTVHTVNNLTQKTAFYSEVLVIKLLVLIKKKKKR